MRGTTILRLASKKLMIVQSVFLEELFKYGNFYIDFIPDE